MLEKEIEKKVCDYAKSLGMLAYKFTSPGRMSVPDRLFITPSGKIFFIEFKRLGKKPTPAQYREHEHLRDKNVTIIVVDNVDYGKLCIEMMMEH